MELHSASIVLVDGVGQTKTITIEGGTEIEAALLYQALRGGGYIRAAAKKFTHTITIVPDSPDSPEDGPYGTVDQMIMLSIYDRTTGKSSTRQIPAPHEGNIVDSMKKGKRLTQEAADAIGAAFGDVLPGGESDAIGGGDWYVTDEAWLKSVK